MEKMHDDCEIDSSRQIESVGKLHDDYEKKSKQVESD
jgi:hypothetical protein